MKNLLPIGIITALALWYLSRRRNMPTLRYFSASEFGVYWPLMSHKLLLMVDEFRHELGYPVSVSPASGAMGRPVINPRLMTTASDSDAESESQHNYLRWGEIRAVDLMPLPPNGATSAERRRWFEIARRVGFTGIGLYPDWTPRAGIHVDVREDHNAGSPATWAGVDGIDGKQTYVGLAQGWA